MAAYLIAELEVQDAAMFEEYRQQVPATIAQYGGRYLVRGGNTEVVEGQWRPKRIVVLEFPSMERLKQWYHSPEYAKILPLRLKAAPTNAVFVEGVGG